MTQHSLKLGQSALKICDLMDLLGQPIQVELDDSAISRIEASRQHVEQAITSGQTHYGINTGFGHLKNVHIAEDQLYELQLNLVRSHAVGVGNFARDEIVRWMMLFKINSLQLGFSGVRRETVEQLAQMLSHDCLPRIPTQGSLGASGDLAPLAHMVLPMIGEGSVTLSSEQLPATEALKKLALRPIRLHAKEGLALINGTQYMAAVAASCLVRANALAKHADIIGSMSLDACQGSLSPYDERLHTIRAHRGAQQVALNMRQLLAASEIMDSHRNCDKVQDPYSLRCMAAVHGATRDAIAHATEIVETEMNSVTDNPIVFDDGQVISGGNFHGQSLALVMDYLAIAIAELASISERRIYLLIDGQDGLPPMLVEQPGLNSGLMILQYTAAALVNENKVLAHPASVDTIPTSMGQEDHVSMGGTSANKLQRILDNAETVLAIEMLCAAQGLDFRSPLKAGKGARAAHEQVSQRIPHADRDRAFKQDIDNAIALLRSGTVIDAVEQAMCQTL